MSLITQCPACATLFKVVPDQLRISDGWVRCGQCDEVFDATAHLQPGLPAPHAEKPSLPEEPVDILQSLAEEEVASPINPDLALADAPEQDSTPAEVGDGPVLDPVFEESPPEVLQVSEPSVEPEFAEVESVPVETEEEHQLSFMRTSRTPSRGSSPLARGALLVLCLLCGGVLLLQVLVQERDRLAAAQPGARQFLESLCGVLDCKISPLRQIESVVIDSSSFTKVRTDVYRLNFTLKNAAPINLATPALELTLTDLQDQAVLRRVIDAGEFASAQGVMVQGAELTVSLPIRVKLSGTAERISGYRLLAFYP